MSMAFRDVAVPDLILGPDEQALSDPTGLNPCPSCDSYQADAPEGIHDHHTARKFPGVKPGDPKWNYPHCFKCGYRPGTNFATSRAQLAREFAEFQNWREQQYEALKQSPTVNADLAAQNEQYKQEIENLRTQIGQQSQGGTSGGS